MFEIISLIVPFFAVIGCGYFGARLIPESQQDGINNLVLYFALPVLIFSLMAQSNIADQFELAFVPAYTIVSIFLFCLAFWLVRALYGLHRGDRAIYALGAVYGNTGYMGIPVIVVLLGESASVPVVISLMIDLIIIIPLAAAVIESSGRQQGNLVHGAMATLLATLRNPLVLASVLGVAWSMLELPIPAMMNGFMDLMGAAAVPCALFAMGASLHGKPLGGAVSPALLISVLKLIIHPLLLWIMMTRIMDIDPDWARPALLAASMPMAATIYVLARQYQTRVVGASTAVLISTGLSLLTFPTLMLMLDHLFAVP